jgi:alpha-1,3-rhamnosyltransferase
MNKIENKEPLVSIIVVAYNSSKFVMDTLESAKKQTYRNIELIVTDDCSTDNTVVLCSNWLDENKERFVRAELITSPKNTGTAPNANRGLLTSMGEWIKFIAADDMLLPNCITELINYIKLEENSDITFLVHGISPFNKDTEFRPVFPPAYFMKKNSAKEQFLQLLKRGNCISGAAFFLQRNTFLSFDGFDENYKLLEDYPLVIKYTLNNYKISFLTKSLVNYRIHDTNTSFEVSKHFQDSYNKFRDEILSSLETEHKLYLTLWHRYLINKKKQSKLIIWKFLSFFSPIDWISNIYKLFGKSYHYNHKIEFQRKLN